jgi:AIPR protein
MKFRRSNEWFGVTEFKSFKDPSGKIERRELLVPLSEYPDDFGLGPNPREPNLGSKVSQAIAETLQDKPEVFHLLNRGVTIIAKDVQYDNQSKRVRLKFHGKDDEPKHYGILDGGNTNERVKVWRGELAEDAAESTLPNTYINVQVLVPLIDYEEMEDTLNDVKEARNTSVQVTDKSLADARNHYDLLKSVLAKEPYADKISWHEGDGGTIDVLDLVGLVVMFYPPVAASAQGGEPNGLYGRRNRALEVFLEHSDINEEDFGRWVQLTPILVRLFDEIQQTLPEHFDGHFGRIAEVRIHDEDKFAENGGKKYRKTPFRSKFLNSEMRYSVPVGFVYPLFSGFRALISTNTKGKKATFRVDPIEFWERNADTLVNQFKPHMQQLSYDPRKIGSSITCYQACRHAVSDCFKNELLKEHGIEI